jgi:hypothetical protein
MWSIWFLLALSLPGLARSELFESEGQKFRFEVLSQRDDVVWGFDFLSLTSWSSRSEGGRSGS